MTVCKICGDRGFSKHLMNCVQCQDAIVHRYCAVGPDIIDDEEYKWSCEDCVAIKTEPTPSCKKSERLRSTVERLAIRNKTRKKWRDNVCLPHVQDRSIGLKETSKEATDPSSLDQKTKDGSVERKQWTLKEHRNPPLHHVSDNADVVISATGVGSEDSIDVNTLNADERGHGATSLDKSSCKVHLELLEKINKNLSRDDCEQQSLKKNRVDKGIQCFDEVPNCAVAKCSNLVADIGKFTSSKSNSKDALKFSDDRLPRLISVESLPPQPSSMKTDDSKGQSLKKKRVFAGMEYSNEEPSVEVAKLPKLVANGGKFTSSNSSNEVLSKLSDDGLPRLASVESVPPRPSLTKIDDCVLTREPSVMFDSHVSAKPSTVKLVNHVPAQPLGDVVWRGCCSIRDNENERPMSLVLEGHLSNKAADRVHGIVYALPEHLNFEFVPKKYAFSKSIDNLPLTGNTIDLYFFPVNEREEKFYECVIDKMIEHDLVLKSNINNVELLVICSVELPLNERSFRRNYYLWGSFTHRKDLINVQSPVPSRNLKRSFYDEKDLRTTRVIDTKTSPFSSNTRINQEHVRPPEESSQRISPRPLKQDYSSRQKDSKHSNVSEREDYNCSSRRFWRPQYGEHHRISKYFNNADRSYSNHKYNSRADISASKWKGPNIRNFRRPHKPYRW